MLVENFQFRPLRGTEKGVFEAFFDPHQGTKEAGTHVCSWLPASNSGIAMLHVIKALFCLGSSLHRHRSLTEMFKRYRLMFSTLRGTRPRYFPSTFPPFPWESLPQYNHPSSTPEDPTLQPQRTFDIYFVRAFLPLLPRGWWWGGGHSLWSATGRLRPKRGPFFDSGIQGYVKGKGT